MALLVLTIVCLPNKCQILIIFYRDRNIMRKIEICYDYTMLTIIQTLTFFFHIKVAMYRYPGLSQVFCLFIFAAVIIEYLK